MCRFTFYMGSSIRLSSLLLDPDHSLIRQSSHSHERAEPLNGDGFGVGWYAPEYTREPAVFRSVTPAWNNRNLHNLARVVASPCIMAHVRAATRSSGVNEANCHPFRFRQYLCMHNGDIGNFQLIRRRLLDSVSDDGFHNVFGSTDSEHLFAVIIDELLKHPVQVGGAETDASILARSLDNAIKRVIELVQSCNEVEHSYLNIALTDGDNAVISRYSDDPDSPPETLYYFVGDLYEPNPAENRNDFEVVVSSEKLTGDSQWQAVPPNHMIVISRGSIPEIRPCGTPVHHRVA